MEEEIVWKKSWCGRSGGIMFPSFEVNEAPSFRVSVVEKILQFFLNLSDRYELSKRP